MYFSHWQAYLIAVVIGLLVGIEREKSHPQGSIGVRTFLLISLLGAIAGGLQNIWFSSILSIFSLSLIIVSYFTQTNSDHSDTDRGLTTEFAAGIVFCLGYVAHQAPVFSALMGPVVTVILFSKKSLHRFTHAIKPSELKAALLLLLGGVIIANLVPDATIDPWGIFNPRKFGYLVLILATLEFSSYVLAKIIGEKTGSLVVGFLGGLVSSTAVLLSSAHQVKKSPQAWRTPLSSALAAKLAALTEFLLIITLISPELLVHTILPAGLAIIIGGAALALVTRKKEKYASELTLKSPLEWKGVLRLSFLMGIILAAISIAEIWFGDNATFAVSFLTGLFELHGVTLANATMHSQGQLSTQAASASINLALISSLVAKIAISWSVNRGTFSRVLTAIFLTMVAIICLAA